MESHTASASRAPDDLSLTKREYVLIAAFWLLYTLLPLGNRLYDAISRSGGENMPAFQTGWIIIPIVDSLCWALLTAPIFWLAAKYGMEGVSSSKRFLLFGAAAIAVIVLVSAPGTFVRMQYLRPPLFRGGHQWHMRSLPFYFVAFNALVVYFGVLAAGFARAYSLRYRSREAHNIVLERQLAEARLDALQRQLDPHFLFNTLNAVASLVERDPRGVRKMISRLGGLLRFSLEGAKTPEITLEKELALLQQYLDIMQVRFQGRLEVITNTDPRVMQALVPTLVLQPLVENAIKHGIEPQRDGGHLTIETKLDGDSVVLRVTDDGPGLASDAPRTMGGGVGLNNTRARLQQLYGDRQHFVLSAGDSRGAVAEVKIPFHA